MASHWKVIIQSPRRRDDTVVKTKVDSFKAYVLQNDKRQDRAGFITYQNTISGEKITVMYVIDGHGLHYDYASGHVDTGNIVASFIEGVIIARDECSLDNSPDDLLVYFNDSSKGVEFYHQIQNALYTHMVEELSKYNIKPSNKDLHCWNRGGRELMIVGGSTFNMAFVYEKPDALPQARVYSVGDSIIAYGDYAVDPNLDGSNLRPETVKSLRSENIEVMYDIRKSSYSHITEKPVYDLDGISYPLPIHFHKGHPQPAYYMSNIREDIAIRFTLSGVSLLKKNRYKMAPFSTMGNFGAPEITRCPQYTDIFDVLEPLSLFSDGIGDCLDGASLTPEESEIPEVQNLTLYYPEGHILSHVKKEPFKFVSTNINREMAANWDDESYIESYQRLATHYFGEIIDDMSFVMFKP